MYVHFYMNSNVNQYVSDIATIYVENSQKIHSLISYKNTVKSENKMHCHNQKMAIMADRAGSFSNNESGLCDSWFGTVDTNRNTSAIFGIFFSNARKCPCCYDCTAACIPRAVESYAELDLPTREQTLIQRWSKAQIPACTRWFR